MNELFQNNPILSRLSERGQLDGLLADKKLCAEVSRAEPQSLRALLVGRGQVAEAEYIQVLAEHLGIPFVVPMFEHVQAVALASVSPGVMSELNALPLMLAEGWLTVAVEAFDDPVVVERIAQHAECQVQVLAAVGDDIRRVREDALRRHGINTPDTRSPSRHECEESPLGEDLALEVLDEQAPDEEDLAAISNDSPVVRLVSRIIREGVESGASDIHIEPHDKEFRIRYRVDGELAEALRTPMRMLPAVVSRIKILSGMDISQRRLPQDGGMSVRVSDCDVDLRVSTMTTKYGEKVVMRLVERDAVVAGLDTLGFEPAMLTRLRHVGRQANGIVLITGPTGSGKTTTLYAMLAELLSEKRNISTIEDPVERKLLGANQFQVNAQAGFTFPSALRALLRQDPDVLMVGEVRDRETARLAMESALTGHLVLSTLHTNDAVTALPRLVNMGVEPYLVAASVRAVLAQRLVRQLCRDCREPVGVNPGQAEILKRICLGRDPVEHVYQSQGCERCMHTGYRGRAGVFELLTFDESMLACMVRGEDVESLRATVRAAGQASMLEDGLDKVEQGVISLEGLLEVLAPATLPCSQAHDPAAPVVVH